MSMSPSHWFIRYKIYHLPFWFAYHTLWWVVNSWSFSTVANNILYSAYSIKFLFYVVFQAIAVYFNLYLLMPRLLEKGKYIQYLLLVILTIIITATLITFGYYVSAALSEKTFFELYGADPNDYLHFFQVNTLPSSVASMTLGMSVKLAKNWLDSKRREQALEKEKLETELKFLRSQFNPHFLFNSINSIFVLIHKNADMASDSLAKFSGLLRYQLYECNEQQLPMDRELAYLENYIDLEKLRQERSVELDVAIDSRHAAGLTIAPFIFIPFIENAFKHVSREADGHNWINMRLSFKEKFLVFKISNSLSAISTVSSSPADYSGIGLQNIKRRLELIYPNKHKLIIEKSPDTFNVNLSINF